MVKVAGVIVIREDGYVLLQKRDDCPGVFFPGYWCYPGGVMETDESPESAARREMAEETGYQPRELFALEGIQYRRSDGVLINPHPFWTRFDSTQKIYCLEGQTISFVDSNNLESLKLIPTQCDIIQKAISLWKQHGYRVNLEKT